MFGGGLVFAKETKANPSPDEPQRDGWFHDLHDALGYAVVGAAESVSDRPVDLTEQEFAVAAAPSAFRRRPMTTEGARDLWRKGRAASRRPRDVYWRAR